MAESAKAAVEVTAGVLPGTPEDQYTKKWFLTSREWEQAMHDGTMGTVLAELNGRALGYAGMLMLQPDRLNWVRTEWIWF